jgi:hypothetical protein
VPGHPSSLNPANQVVKQTLGDADRAVDAVGATPRGRHDCEASPVGSPPRPESLSATGPPQPRTRQACAIKGGSTRNGAADQIGHLGEGHMEMWERSRRLVSEIARECAPGPQARLNRPSSTILLVGGRRRRPIDGLSMGQTDSYVAKRGGSADHARRRSRRSTGHVPRARPPLAHGVAPGRQFGGKRRPHATSTVSLPTVMRAGHLVAPAPSGPSNTRSSTSSQVGRA